MTSTSGSDLAVARDLDKARHKRVVEGLRNFGYTFPVAVADLVDNSIEAGASVIDIQMHLEQDGKPAVSIADDGCGMDRDGLLHAMRFGAAAVDDPSRLGRFGLGLKAASFGFCRRLTLVSTPGGGVQEMFATWDLDVVATKNRGIYMPFGEATSSQADAFDEARDLLAELSGARPDKGTLVIWDKVDRLLVKRHGGAYANPATALKTKTTELREHLSLVFQRYLDPDDDRATNVVIAVNGERVEPWDPFCEKWAQVEPELQNVLQLENLDGQDLGQVLVRGFILPKNNDIDDPAYKDEAKISLKNQGVYVYRENRMIEGPIWLGFTKEPHLSQLRIDVSYQAIHDEFFIVDIKKKDLKIEPGLDERIREILAPLRAEANSRARGRGRRPPGTFETEEEQKAIRSETSLEGLLREPGAVDSPRAEGLDLVRRNLRITGKEIRIMAGVKFSSAIQNWRNGKKGFPEPVVGGHSPLFNLSEVHAWLKAHDKLANEPGADWYWRKWVQALPESVEQGGRFLRAYVTSVVFVLPDFRTDKDGWADRFHDIHTAEGFDQWSAGKDNLEELVEFLRKHLLGVEFRDSGSSTRTSMARAFWHAVNNGFIERDLLDQALDTLSGLTDTQNATSLPLSDLITRLVADLPGPPSSFLDLASGEATVLANLASHSGLPDLQLSGFELDGDVAAISKIRLGYLDNETAWEIHVRDSLDEGDPRPRGTFDAVLVDPPTKKIPRWINHSAALLNKTTASRAFILLPEAALAVDGPCAGSIKRKRLEAVVLLPNRLKRESRGLVLCIFTSDQATCDEVLVIDLGHKADDYEDLADDACAAISHWRDTQTINAALLPGRQRSIGAEAAAIHDLKDWDLVDLEPYLIHTGEVQVSDPGKPLMDDVDPVDGYSGKRAAEIAGVTYSQLDYWARTGLVLPSLADAQGRGTRRQYSYRDLLELRAVKSLLDAGIRLDLVREVFAYLADHLDEDVTRVNLVISGSSVMVRTGEEEIVDLLRNGRGVLNILPLSGVKEDLDAEILKLHPGDAPDQAVLEGHGP